MTASHERRDGFQAPLSEPERINNRLMAALQRADEMEAPEYSAKIEPDDGFVEHQLDLGLFSNRDPLTLTTLKGTTIDVRAHIWVKDQGVDVTDLERDADEQLSPIWRMDNLAKLVERKIQIVYVPIHTGRFPNTEYSNDTQRGCSIDYNAEIDCWKIGFWRGDEPESSDGEDPWSEPTADDVTIVERLLDHIDSLTQTVPESEVTEPEIDLERARELVNQLYALTPDYSPIGTKLDELSRILGPKPE